MCAARAVLEKSTMMLLTTSKVTEVSRDTDRAVAIIRQ